jgi:hypothetical protein
MRGFRLQILTRDAYGTWLKPRKVWARSRYTAVLSATRTGWPDADRVVTLGKLSYAVYAGRKFLTTVHLEYSCKRYRSTAVRASSSS